VRIFPVLILLAGCSSEGSLIPNIPPLELTVASPSYGEFVGYESVEVRGQVSHKSMHVEIEGQVIEVADDGSFSTLVEVPDDFRNIDIWARLSEESEEAERVRIPVFRGYNPMDTWPGMLTARLTERGLNAIGGQVGEMIDSLGWEESITSALPTIETDWFSLYPGELTHDPTMVVMTPSEDGIDMVVTMENVLINMDVDLFGLVLPGTLGFETIEIGVMAVPDISDSGDITLSLTDSTVDMSDAVVEVAGIDVWLLELIIDGVAGLTGGLGQSLIDGILGGVGELSIGGPFEFDADLLGTQIAFGLDEIDCDTEGVALELGLSINDMGGDLTAEVPAPAGTGQSDLVLGVHEGLIQMALETDLLDLLSQEMELSGLLGDIIGMTITALPGGHNAPEVDSWCLSLAPNDARVARFKTGIDPLAVISMPDVPIDIGYRIGTGGECTPWLTATMALQIGLTVEDGTKLGFDIAIPDGAVYYYGAPGDRDELEIVQQLGGVFDSLIGLVGTQLEFDLADMFGLGGGDDILLGGIAPEIVHSTPVFDVNGEPVEGMYGVELLLWP
jgi:hypothetical protein